jgi:hypothetical protein
LEQNPSEYQKDFFRDLNWIGLRPERHAPKLLITTSNVVWWGKNAKTILQEAILGQTPSYASEKGGLPIQKLTDCAIRIEEFKR